MLLKIAYTLVDSGVESQVEVVCPVLQYSLFTGEQCWWVLIEEGIHVLSLTDNGDYSLEIKGCETTVKSVAIEQQFPAPEVFDKVVLLRDLNHLIKASGLTKSRLQQLAKAEGFPDTVAKFTPRQISLFNELLSMGIESGFPCYETSLNP